MTEGQWLYMIANMTVDDEDEFEKLCDKCKANSENVKCAGCGDEQMHNARENNPNFDESKFDKYKSVRD